MSNTRGFPAVAVVLGLAGLLAAARRAGGDLVVQTWAVGGQATHPKTVRIADAPGGGAVIQVDLSALPKGAKVRRARLLVEREHLDGSDEEAIVASEVFPLRAAYRPGGKPAPDRKPLDVAPPWHDHFDATDLVRRWASGKAPAHGLYVKALPKWIRDATRLEIACEVAAAARGAKPPPQPAGLKVLHRAGQTFITFREIADAFGGRAVKWGELRDALAEMDRRRRVRYRVYRHTRRIDRASVARAELLAEIKPLSGYNVNSWSKERLINQAVFGNEDSGELAKYNPFAGWDRDSPQGGRLIIPRFVIAEGQGPLPAGVGLYVHSAAKAEKAFYAVVTAIDGTANTADFSPHNSLTKPLAESPARWEPVAQGDAAGEFGFDFPGRKVFYVTWVAPPMANVPYRYFNWSVHLPQGMNAPPAAPGGASPATRAAPMNVSFHDAGFSYAKPLRRFDRSAVQIAAHDFGPVSGWYGYHECLGTLRGWKDGKVRPYTERRILAFIEWAKRKWKIDPRRCFTDGRGTGGTGAIHFACKHPELFAYVLNDCGAVCCADSTQLPALESAWGRVQWRMENDAGVNVWDWQDLTWFVRSRGRGRELPVLSISPRGHTAWQDGYPRRTVADRKTRWLRSHRDFTVLFKALTDNRHMFFADFDWGPTLAILPHWMDVTVGPVPAVTNSTDKKVQQTDDGPYIFFEPSGSSPSGWIHWHHRWRSSDAVDRPDRLEMTLYVTGGEVTADVTPRRARKFRPKPGEKLRWSNTCLCEGEKTWASRNVWKKYPEKKVIQSGTVTADEHGVVTIPAVTILQTKSRVVIHR